MSPTRFWDKVEEEEEGGLYHVLKLKTLGNNWEGMGAINMDLHKVYYYLVLDI